MDAESRLRRVLEQEAAIVQPNVPEALGNVHGLARRRTARRRATVAVAATAAAVTAVTLVAAALGARHRAEPAPVPDPELPRVTLSIVNERSAVDLGIQQALSLALGAHGQVYVTDTSQHVTELTPDLRPVRTWGATEPLLGSFG